MLNVVYTLVSGLLVLLFCKICLVCYNYQRFCRLLRKVPTTSEPAHWIMGNLKKGQHETVEDVPESLPDYRVYWTCEHLYGHRVNAEMIVDIFKKRIKDSKSYVDLVLREANEAKRKILLLWFGPFPSISITHPDTFKQLAKQVSLKARGPMDGYTFFEPWLGEGLLISGGKKWERNRKLLTPAFHFDILNGYVHVMNDVANTLLGKLETVSTNDAIVDVFPHVCKASLDTMLRCSLSYNGNVQSDTESEYIRTVKRLSEINWERSLKLTLLSDTIFNHSSIGREFYRLCDEAHKFTGSIIQARRKELDQQADITEQKRHLDFLDILLTARDEHGHGLSPEEIQDEVDTFTFEGHDTTSSAISWTIYALAKYPELQAKVFRDVQDVLQGQDVVTTDHLGKFKYLPLFVKEVLRYFSPVPMIGRRHTDKPVVIDGIEIPVGVSMWVQIYAIHHNEAVWKNHEVFDPERFHADRRDDTEIYGFIPFSAGTRNCIGQVFAMNEIKITIAKFISRFEVLLVPEQEAVLVPDIIMRAENGINVKLRRRQT